MKVEIGYYKPLFQRIELAAAAPSGLPSASLVLARTGRQSGRQASRRQREEAKASLVALCSLRQSNKSSGSREQGTRPHKDSNP
jgi:hypothetical protein